MPAQSLAARRDIAETLAIGDIREDIVGYRLHDVMEIDGTRRLASLGLLIAAVLVLGLGMLSLDWRTQAMLASVVCALVAVVCGLELLGVTPRTLYRVALLHRDGRQIDVNIASLDDTKLPALDPTAAATLID